VKHLKSSITYGFAALFFLGIIIMFYGITSDIKAPSVSTESFSEALWNNWGVAILIVAFVIFAGGTGILVLLGGGWRWE
jgi:hypothetical protein